jgi:ABC-type multidrug transport system fused ATPase/permease subunit
MAEHATPRRVQDSSADLRRSRHLSRVPAADPSLRRSQWSRLAMLIGDRKRTVALLALCSVVAAMCEAGILAVAARAATSLVDRAHQAQGKFGPVHLSLSTPDLLYVGLGLALLRLLLQIPNSYLPARIAGDVQAAMRVRLMRAYSHASWEKQSQDREGHFQEMMSNQIQQASTGALQTTQLIIAFCTFLILVAGAFALNPVGAGVVFVAASLMFAALRPANARAMRLARQLSAAQLEYAGAVGEANRMTEETNVFGVAGPQSKRVDAYVMVARGLFVRVQVLARGVPNLYQSLIYIILVAGLLVISLSGLSHFSELGAVVLLLVRAGSYGQQVQTFWVSLRQSLPFVERLENSINGYAESTPVRGDVGLQTIESLAFEKVTYSYQPDRPVLRDVSFAVERGETIGVVGPSGAGKSTIVQILLSLRDPRSGRYAINGIDATQIKLSDLHRRIAYVPQAPKLLHASVAENVRFHRDYDDAAVERACRLAFIHDEIMSWPAGYDTIVGPRADAVSGGQQQRICLARALVSSPSILVLDEPTSALDPRSEGLIQQSLEELRDQMTLFIVAHRMSTLSICDRVMVVLDGELNAFATLPELSESNDYYRFASGFASASASPG